MYKVDTHRGDFDSLLFTTWCKGDIKRKYILSSSIFGEKSSFFGSVLSVYFEIGFCYDY